jgi:hypothetical protein
VKPGHVFIVFSVLIFALSCSSTNFANPVSVHYDYDPEVDFAVLRSYDWFPVPKKNVKHELTIKLIKEEINNQLKVRGIERGPANPDFLIAIHGGIQSWLDYTDWEYLHANYEQYAAKRKTDLSKHSDETLIIDFIDTKTKTLIYRATAITTISIEPTPEKRQKKISKAITRIMDTYTQVLTN